MDNYISRQKYELDEKWRVNATRDEALREGEAKGRQEGRLEGEFIGRIETLQEILGLTEPTRDQLAAFDVKQLTDVLERLRTQLQSRQK